MRVPLLLSMLLALLAIPDAALGQDGEDDPQSQARELDVEPLDVWVQGAVLTGIQRGNGVRVSVWFDRQLLGDGAAYQRRAAVFARDGWTRSELRQASIRALKAASEKSQLAAKEALDGLKTGGQLKAIERHWVINGFTATIATPDDLRALKSVPGVRKIFLVRPLRTSRNVHRQVVPTAFQPVEHAEFDSETYEHPWYTHYLMAVKTWQTFGVAGAGTLNVIHDGNFVFSPQLIANIHHAAGEIPGNGKDDDGNGLVDDAHGYNFDAGNARLTTQATRGNQLTHGDSCAAAICAPGVAGKPVEFGIAPEARWAGVIGGSHLEAAVEWAIEQGADTYSMSFSIPGLGEARSHWRKVMEHASLCGIYFVSGAGNFAQQVEVPVQMRTPEDIPEVVFAAAGVQRDFSRTVFSSQGPVLWETEHYKDGEVQKPEVCAFNFQVPTLTSRGDVARRKISGNSFAGPMFCGSISLLLSADPELLPWDLKEIIQTTATDLADPGVDAQTGHGLINCYRAVKEVLRRRAVREGRDASDYEGRTAGDELDVDAVRKLLNRRLEITAVQAGGRAARKGVKVGDVVLTVAGVKVLDARAMAAAVNGARGVGSFEMVVRRGTEEVTVTFTGAPLGLSATELFDQPTHW